MKRSEHLDIPRQRAAGRAMELDDYTPCSIGCLSHITHPCEKCGRIGGVPLPGFWAYYVGQLRTAIERLKAEDASLELMAAEADEFDMCPDCPYKAYHDADGKVRLANDPDAYMTAVERLVAIREELENG